ncbi:MAG: biotin--[acetyl-CoA-carboxylase] ligase [Ekhidna sp.]
MHKIFAKPLFLGKKILFLPQCHSTNEELIGLAKKSKEPEGFITYTDHQKSGRGQRGNAWLGEAGKNILMSILLRPSFVSPSKQFLLNLITGLAVIDALESYLPKENFLLKWPNDIYLNGKKIGGILIESNLKGSKLEFSVVGLGLNVNQSGFSLRTATSLFLESGTQLAREELMEDIVSNLEKWYLKLKNGDVQLIQNSYLDKLMWKDQLRIFGIEGQEMQGIIRGIDMYGKLKVEIGGEVQLFNIKEIQFLR